MLIIFQNGSLWRPDMTTHEAHVNPDQSGNPSSDNSDYHLYMKV